MTIRKKLFLNSFITILIAVVLIGVVIVGMLSVRASNSDVMPKILAINAIHLDYTQIENELNAYATALSVAQPQSVTDDAYMRVEHYFASIEKNYLTIDKSLSSAQEAETFSAFLDKHDAIKEGALAAITMKDVNASRMHAARILGALNDIHLLDVYANTEYDTTQQQLDKRITSTITLAIAGIVLLLVIGAVFSIMTTRAITRPLHALAERAERIANGELNVDMLTHKSSDEIGTLNAAFSEMAVQLKTLIASIQTASGKITHFTTDLLVENQQVKEISEEVTFAVDQLSSGTQHVASSIYNTVELVEKMDDDFTNNVNRSSRSVQRSEDAANAITASKDAIQFQQALIQENIDTTAKINLVSEQFLHHTTSIEKMAKAVADIADQTNLLALNASIEAARAGEHGKGFSVVAEEVRKLAEQSNASTTEIFEIVAAIKQGIDEMSKSVQNGVNIAEKQQGSINETTDAFALIEREVSRIMDEIAHVASDMQHSQNLGTQVMDNINSVNVVVEQAAQNSEEISASTSTQLEAIANVVSKVEELQNLTTELNSTIGKFKMD